EDARGFLALLNGGEAQLSVANTLGVAWRLKDPGLLFKLNPVCSAAHAAIEATAQLVHAAGIAVSRIERIRCRVPELVRISLVFDRPETPQEAQFSLPYAVACAALHGRVRLADLDPAEMASSVKRALMAKIVQQLAPELSSEEMRARYPESARIE